MELFQPRCFDSFSKAFLHSYSIPFISQFIPHLLCDCCIFLCSVTLSPAVTILMAAFICAIHRFAAQRFPFYHRCVSRRSTQLTVHQQIQRNHALRLDISETRYASSPSLQMNNYRTVAADMWKELVHLLHGAEKSHTSRANFSHENLNPASMLAFTPSDAFALTRHNSHGRA